MAAGLLLDEIFSILLLLNLLRRFELRIFFTLQVVSLAWFQWVMTELKLTIFLYTCIRKAHRCLWKDTSRADVNGVYFSSVSFFTSHLLLISLSSLSLLLTHICYSCYLHNFHYSHYYWCYLLLFFSVLLITIIITVVKAISIIIT